MFDVYEAESFVRILKLLSEIDKIEEYLTKRKKGLNSKNNIRAYKLFILVCINQIFDILITRPSDFGITADYIVRNAHSAQVERDKFPRSSSLAILLLNVNGVMSDIRKADSKKKLKKIFFEIEKTLIEPINHIIENHFETGSNYKKYSKESLILKITRYHFYLLFHNFVRMGNSYTEALLNRTIDSLKDDIKLFSEKKEFFETYKIIIDYLWRELLQDKYQNFSDVFTGMVESESWQEYGHFIVDIGDNVIGKLEKDKDCIDPDNKEVLIRTATSRNYFKEAAKIEFYERKEPNIYESLDELFYWVPARLVGRGNKFSYTLICLLRGLIKSKKDKIEVLRIDQTIKYPGKEYKEYNFAILVEDSYVRPMWLAFFEVDEIWAITKEINRYKRKINYRQKELPTKDFTKEKNTREKEDIKHLNYYIADNTTKEFDTSARRFYEYKSECKGIIFELYMSYLLKEMGYKTKWRVKESFTNNREIDVLAFKEIEKEKRIEFVIVEASTNNEDITREIKEKLCIIERNKRELLNYLGVNEEYDCNFKGKMVTVRNPKYTKVKEIEAINIDELEKLANKTKTKFSEIKRIVGWGEIMTEKEEIKKIIEDIHTDPLLNI